MRRLSILSYLIPYTHLFSARERHIFAAGAVLLQMAAITPPVLSLLRYELFDKPVGNQEIQPASIVSFVYQFGTEETTSTC